MTVKISKLIPNFMYFEKSSSKNSQDGYRKRAEAVSSRCQGIINILENRMVLH